MPNPVCFNCIHENMDTPNGGPDLENNGVCMGCEGGDMYDDGMYGGGRFVAG